MGAPENLAGIAGIQNITGDRVMQKKLLAIAVAGALGAPAVAVAQSSTVQIFGTLYIEYSYADQGSAPNLSPTGRIAR